MATRTKPPRKHTREQQVTKSLRVPPSLWEELEQLAVREERGISQQVIFLLRQALEHRQRQPA